MFKGVAWRGSGFQPAIGREFGPAADPLSCFAKKVGKEGDPTSGGRPLADSPALRASGGRRRTRRRRRLRQLRRTSPPAAVLLGACRREEVRAEAGEH